MDIVFLHGTETGTTEVVCEDMETAISGKASSTIIQSLEDTAPCDLMGDVLYVVACSTFGTGDLPATAETFYKALQNESPDLSGVRFAIFGMGDTSFGETFNQGSEKLMTELLRCGAKRVGERGLADASSDDLPDEVAVKWVEGIVELATSPA